MITVKHVLLNAQLPILPMELTPHVDALRYAQYMNSLRIIQECASVTVLMDLLQMPMLEFASLYAQLLPISTVNLSITPVCIHAHPIPTYMLKISHDSACLAVPSTSQPSLIDSPEDVCLPALYLISPMLTTTPEDARKTVPII